MSRVDRLYRLPRAEFTAARNDLARELRAAGDREEAERVQRLAKPSIAAWLVNRLFHEHRPAFDALLGAAEDQRRSLRRQGSMSATAGARQRQAVKELLESARAEAEAAGSNWTPALRQRVVRTLEAVAAAPPEGNQQPGRLTTDLEAPGFDALLGTAIAATGTGGSSTGSRKPRRPASSAAATRRREQARTRVDASRKAATAARRKRAAAKKKLAQAEARAVRSERSARLAEEKAEVARSRAQQADLERREARAAVDDAERTLARAESRLAEETRKLDALR